MDNIQVATRASKAPENLHSHEDWCEFDVEPERGQCRATLLYGIFTKSENNSTGGEKRLRSNFTYQFFIVAFPA